MTLAETAARGLVSYFESWDKYQDQRDVARGYGGGYVKQMRTDRKHSLRALAAILEVSPSFLCKIENGREPLGPELARKVAIWYYREIDIR
jgi:DNA-binding XRE family transcriptional regulator